MCLLLGAMDIVGSWLGRDVVEVLNGECARGDRRLQSRCHGLFDYLTADEFEELRPSESPGRMSSVELRRTRRTGRWSAACR